ncbi:MAG: OmpW family protein, partial [Gammaproteobacteria bacterium]|nr:OmpW family protein [Gammaproteobacteria bacterium]
MKRMILAAVALALVSSAAIAETSREAGSWFVRAGVGGVFPKSNNLTVSGVGTIDVGEAYAITLTGGYMITD